MLARDADSCYWIGRYVERAEAMARIVDVHYHASLESGNAAGRWSRLIGVLGGDSGDVLADDRRAFHWFAFDPSNPDAIVPVWGRARENARTMREQISSEMWEALNVAWLELREWDVDKVFASSPDHFFTKVRNASHLFQGILSRTMLFDEGRDWLDAGRFLERAGQTVRQLSVCVGESVSYDPPVETGALFVDRGWTAALRSASGLEMYRKAHPAGIDPVRIVDFLVLDERFPASVRHAIREVDGCLHRISGGREGTPTCRSERLCGRLEADLAYAEPGSLQGPGLPDQLAKLMDRIDSIGEAILADYLQY